MGIGLSIDDQLQQVQLRCQLHWRTGGANRAANGGANEYGRRSDAERGNGAGLLNFMALLVSLAASMLSLKRFCIARGWRRGDRSVLCIDHSLP